MTSRTRRLVTALSAVPLAAAAIAVLGAQAAHAEDNSDDSTRAGQHEQHQDQTTADDPVGEIAPDLGDIVSDRRVKRDITPVDWSR